MATVRRSLADRRKHKREREQEDDDDEIVLPTEVESPGGELNDFSFLFHGVKKIGKTKLSLETDDPDDKVLVLQFDPGQIAYERIEIVIERYKQFRKVLKSLEKAARKKKFPYKRIVVDRCDTWYFLCEKFVKEKLAIDKMNEEPYGGAWTMVKEIFTEDVDRILRLPCGKWFLCHSTQEAEENRHGDEIMKLKPNLNKRADEILNGKCDAWFAYVYEEDKRYLIVQGDERTGAGHRIDGHFLTPEDEPIVAIPMGNSSKKAYENFIAAFNNEQEVADPVKEGGKSKKRLRVRVRD